MDIKYPNIEVELTGSDGNAFLIIARVLRALRLGGVCEEDRDEFSKEATSGDYDNVLVTCMQWVTVT